MVAIGEASRLSGVPIETIRYYEREGIIAKAGRTASGRRAYSDAEISELRFIRRCRDLGFPLGQVVELRNMAKTPGTSCQTVETVGTRHLEDVRSKIVELKQLERALAELISNCSDGRNDCPLLEALAS